MLFLRQVCIIIFTSFGVFYSESTNNRLELIFLDKKELEIRVKNDSPYLLDSVTIYPVNFGGLKTDSISNYQYYPIENVRSFIFSTTLELHIEGKKYTKYLSFNIESTRHITLLIQVEIVNDRAGERKIVKTQTIWD